MVALKTTKVKQLRKRIKANKSVFFRNSIVHTCDDYLEGYFVNDEDFVHCLNIYYQGCLDLKKEDFHGKLTKIEATLKAFLDDLA